MKILSIIVTDTGKCRRNPVVRECEITGSHVMTSCNMGEHCDLVSFTDDDIVHPEITTLKPYVALTGTHGIHMTT